MIPGPVTRSLQLASLLPNHPQEFYDRIAGIAEFHSEVLLGKTLTKTSFEYTATNTTDAIQLLGASLGESLGPFFAEDGLREIEQHVRGRIEALRALGPFGLFHNADFLLARLAYALCRALRPAVVLETGVAYGVSSAFVLKALEENGLGVLHSIDLPPLGKDSDHFVGFLIPDSLRGPWKLYRGVSRRVMPTLLPGIGRVGLFLHDAMHTYRNMSWELGTVTPHMARPSAVIVDDIDYNSAFRDWTNAVHPDFAAILSEQEKADNAQRRKLLGLAAFP